MREPVIVAARRTPVGRFLGGGAGLSAMDLGVAAATAALAGIDPAAIDRTIVGNVLGAGAGQNVARQIALRAGVPASSPAFTVNLVCGSGLQAVVLAAQAVLSGEADAVLCGGTESMSNAPLLRQRAPESRPLESDSLLLDGLTDAGSGEHMVLTAERIAVQQDISRLEQDAYALESQRRYAEALAAGVFSDELVPVGSLVRDEHPRPGTPPAKLASLKPVVGLAGTVTPANASGLNDGAAMLVVADAAVARQRGWPALARIDAWALAGCEPGVMGLGPIHAVNQLHQRHGARAYDHIELNEAFAVQALACIRGLGLDQARTNPHGGAIAIGHPLGATGARLAVHLAQRTAAGSSRSSLATLCIGGGMGLAVAFGAP